MLSDQEKKEMLQDGRSLSRRNDFRAARNETRISFEDYLIFLSDIQKIFSPFAISVKPTLTKVNRL